jgi:sulfur carrier protein
VITVSVNGVVVVVAEGCSLGALLEERATPDKGVAVAMDLEVIRRADWHQTTLRDGAVIEVVTAAAGG